MTHKRTRRFIPAALAVAACFLTTSAVAQEAKLSLELNATSDVEGSCRMSFLVRNELAQDVEALVVETVIFTKEFQVDRLTLFDFQSVPVGRPRVRQFDLSGTACSDVGSVLINGVDSCEGGSLTPDICQAALDLSTRTEIGVDG